MSGALLRSGAMRDYFALGAVGHPVYQSASQLRVAMRSQLGADVADIFALPKKNDRGDFVDWYAPMNGTVVPWTSATDQERVDTFELLQSMHERVKSASEKLLSETDSERQVFGRMLQHVMSFPDDQHVYLVDGNPVLTFWGFRHLDGSTLTDPLAVLGNAPAAPVAPVDVVQEPEPQIVEEEVAYHRRWPWWLWPLLLLFLLLIFLFFLRSCSTTLDSGLPSSSTGDVRIQPEDEIVPEPVVIENDATEAISDKVTVPSNSTSTVTEDVLPGTSTDQQTQVEQREANESMLPESEPVPPEMPEPDQVQPEMPEEDQPPPEPPELAPQDSAEDLLDEQLEEPREPEDAPEPLMDELSTDEPPQGTETPLTIPPDALEQSDLDFLNGKWSSNSGLIDETGRPVRLDYDFSGGEGEVSLKRSDGTICRGKASAEVSGQGLTISDQGQIRCADGQLFQPSTVDCKMGADGKANCNGRYDTGSAFPVEIHKAE